MLLMPTCGISLDEASDLSDRIDHWERIGAVTADEAAIDRSDVAAAMLRRHAG